MAKRLTNKTVALPAGEKRELHLPLEGGGRDAVAGGGDHRERHSQLHMPQITPPRHYVPTLPLKGRVKLPQTPRVTP